MDVRLAPSLTVGYVMGTGDEVPAALRGLGAEVKIVPMRTGRSPGGRPARRNRGTGLFVRALCIEPEHRSYGAGSEAALQSAIRHRALAGDRAAAAGLRGVARLHGDAGPARRTRDDLHPGRPEEVIFCIDCHADLGVRGVLRSQLTCLYNQGGRLQWCPSNPVWREVTLAASTYPGQPEPVRVAGAPIAPDGGFAWIGIHDPQPGDLESLQQLWDYKEGSVLGINLQCYSGGSGNDPGTWIAAVSEASSRAVGSM